MSYLLKLEELAELLLGIWLFTLLDYSWWIFPALILLPDVGMAGYLFNLKTGAWLYNLFHHKAVAITCYLVGIWLAVPVLQLAGIIIFSHAAMDRMFGYGLKYSDSFKHTHLGWLGNTRGTHE